MQDEHCCAPHQMDRSGLSERCVKYSIGFMKYQTKISSPVAWGDNVSEDWTVGGLPAQPADERQPQQHEGEPAHQCGVQDGGDLLDRSANHRSAPGVVSFPGPIHLHNIWPRRCAHHLVCSNKSVSSHTPSSNARACQPRARRSSSIATYALLLAVAYFCTMMTPSRSTRRGFVSAARSASGSPSTTNTSARLPGSSVPSSRPRPQTSRRFSWPRQ